jgi:tetratricopeptide (TPR) repeat protein
VGTAAASWILILALGAAPAAQGSKDEARRYLRSAAAFYDALDFDRALEQAKKAEALSKNPDVDVEIALVEGVLLATLERDDEADAAFRRGLSLQAEAKLPYKVSPKIVEQFEKVRAQVKKSLARQPQVEPDVVNPPPSHPEVPPTATTVIQPAPSGGARRYAWIPAVGGVLIGGAGAFALSQSESKYSQLVNPQTPPLSPATAAQYRTDGATYQTGAIILFAVGGACLVGAGAMALFGGPSTSVAIAPAPNGAVLAGTFP